MGALWFAYVVVADMFEDHDMHVWHNVANQRRSGNGIRLQLALSLPKAAHVKSRCKVIVVIGDSESLTVSMRSNVQVHSCFVLLILA